MLPGDSMGEYRYSQFFQLTLGLRVLIDLTLIVGGEPVKIERAVEPQKLIALPADRKRSGARRLRADLSHVGYLRFASGASARPAGSDSECSSEVHIRGGIPRLKPYAPVRGLRRGCEVVVFVVECEIHRGITSFQKSRVALTNRL